METEIDKVSSPEWLAIPGGRRGNRSPTDWKTEARSADTGWWNAEENLNAGAGTLGVGRGMVLPINRVLGAVSSQH